MQTTTTARERLELAQQELDQAQEVADNERRHQLVTQLGEVRAELRQARARHQELMARSHKEREARDNAQAKVAQVLEQLAESERTRPAVADYLPEDVEVVAWREIHEALEAKRGRLIAQRDKLPDPDLALIEANRYAGPFGMIATLEFAESNILRQLEGQGGVIRIEGGVYGVR
jgi:hypothetical protein